MELGTGIPGICKCEASERPLYYNATSYSSASVEHEVLQRRAPRRAGQHVQAPQKSQGTVSAAVQSDACGLPFKNTPNRRPEQRNRAPTSSAKSKALGPAFQREDKASNWKKGLFPVGTARARSGHGHHLLGLHLDLQASTRVPRVHAQLAHCSEAYMPLDFKQEPWTDSVGLKHEVAELRQACDVAREARGGHCLHPGAVRNLAKLWA